MLVPIALTLFGLGLAMGIVRGQVVPGTITPDDNDESGLKSNRDYFSKHFTADQVTASATATRRNIDNTASEEIMNNARLLAQNVLDPLVDRLGYTPNIVSWYRNLELNAAVGGSATSDHLRALAADLDGERNGDILPTLVNFNIPFDQVILYGDIDNPDFVHVSFEPSRGRNQKKEVLLKRDGYYQELTREMYI